MTREDALELLLKEAMASLDRAASALILAQAGHDAAHETKVAVTVLGLATGGPVEYFEEPAVAKSAKMRVLKYGTKLGKVGERMRRRIEQLETKWLRPHTCEW